MAHDSADSRLYTASWRKLSRFDSIDRQPRFVPVRTSVGKPRFVKNANSIPFIAELAPFGLLKIQDWREFERRYRHRLERNGVDRIEAAFTELLELYDGFPLVLLCYENVERGEGCHRRLFSSWWTEQTGEEVPELESFDLLAEPRQLQWHASELAPEKPHG